MDVNLPIPLGRGEDRDEARRHVAEARHAAGLCPYVEAVTIAEIVDEHGHRSMVEVPEYDSRRQAIIVKLMMSTMIHGPQQTGGLRVPPREVLRHPGDCPLCRQRAMPGPRVYGVLLADDLEAEPSRRILPHWDERLEEFANLEHAHALVREWAGLLSGREPNVLGDASVRVQTPRMYVHRTPTFGPRMITTKSQLWLWHTVPAGDPRGWRPDVVLAVRDGQAVTLAAQQVEADLDAKLKQQADAAPVRSSGFAKTAVGDLTITWMNYKRRLLVSILDRTSTAPAVRVLSDGRTEPLPDAPDGLRVFGRQVADRPELRAGLARLPEYAADQPAILAACR